MLVTRKGMTKCQELRAAKSPRKVFRGDGISNRTPEDQAGFPGRDRASPGCRGSGPLQTLRPGTWVHGDEFCVLGGEREEGRGEEEVGITLLGALNARQESRLCVGAAGNLLENKNRNFLSKIK